MPVSRRVFIAISIFAFAFLIHGAYAYVGAGKLPSDSCTWLPMMALPYGLQSCAFVIAPSSHIRLGVPLVVIALVVTDVCLACVWCSTGKDAMVDQTIIYYSEFLLSFCALVIIVLSRIARGNKGCIKTA